MAHSAGSAGVLTEKSPTVMGKRLKREHALQPGFQEVPYPYTHGVKEGEQRQIIHVLRLKALLRRGWDPALRESEACHGLTITKATTRQRSRSV